MTDSLTDNDYIRAAVELTEGWRLQNEILVIHTETNLWMFLDRHVQQILDALAAELVRMVDALNPDYSFASAYPHYARVVGRNGTDIKVEGPDRTMNTIRAVVEALKK